DAQSGEQMTDEGIGRTEQFAAHAGMSDEGAHEQKHRDDAESVVGDGPHRGLPDQLERGRAAVEISEARYADEAHRHADRHAQQHHRKQGEKTNDRDGVGTHRHSTGLISFCTAGSTMYSGWKMRRYVRIAISSTAETSPSQAIRKNGQVGSLRSKVRTLSARVVITLSNEV